MPIESHSAPSDISDRWDRRTVSNPAEGWPPSPYRRSRMPAAPNAMRRMLQDGFPLCLMPSRPLSPLHVAVFQFVDHCTVVRGQSLHPLRLKGLRSASCTLE